MVVKLVVRPLVLTVAASLVGGAAWAALWADNVPTSVVADGDFESAGPALRLEPRAPYPLIAGGWGVRAGDAGRVEVVAAEDGGKRLEIEARSRDAAQLLQDVPLATRAFVLELTVQRVRGRQQVVLLGEWDRADGMAVDAVTLELTASGLGVATAAGSWQLPIRLPSGRQVKLQVIGDTRDEQLRVNVDGRLAGVFPGLPASRPSTLILGSPAGPGSSLVRYDDISLLRLAEVELAAVRTDLQREAPVGLSRHLDRLEAAAQALHDGAGFLALPEVRAVARELQLDDAAQASPALRGMLALARLLETS